ncbi:hypothetical protein GCM10007086_29650 [Photobacterium aphoticum]|nr:hypothetical protein GCM10007086_29650 [Photobacterium aphoticum]
MICYELDDHDEAISLVKKLDSSASLYELLNHYNWDDGFVTAADYQHIDKSNPSEFGLA